MNFKLILFLATIFVNDIQGWPIIPWALRLDQRVGVVLGKISSTINETGLKIDKANNSIQFEIKSARDSLTNELNQLNSIIAEAQIEAKQTGKSVQPCLDQKNAELASVDLSLLDTCNANIQLDQIGNSMAVLGILEGTTFKNVKFCLFQSPGDQTCIDSVLEQIENHAEGVQQQVLKQLGDIQEASINCVQQNMTQQDEKVNRAADTFKSCYQNL